MVTSGFQLFRTKPWRCWLSSECIIGLSPRLHSLSRLALALGRSPHFHSCAFFYPKFLFRIVAEATIHTITVKSPQWLFILKLL